LSARRLVPLSLAAATALLVAAPVAVAAGPPLPVAQNGNAVSVVGTGVATPTAFAFGGGRVFVADGPSETPGATSGGVFTLAGGKAKKIPGIPAALGLAYRSNTLYVSTGPKILAFSRWTGKKFAKSKTIYKNTKTGYPGTNGLAFGPDGRLYTGISLNQKYDHAQNPFKPSNAVVSLTTSGKSKLKVVARGLRQPFQLSFPKGSKAPLVTSLSQDQGTVPPDELVLAKQGTNFGFPTCTWLTPQPSCGPYDEPQALFPAHSSPMGVAAVGDDTYVALFGGIGKSGPEVVKLGVDANPQPFLTGFVAPIVGLGVKGDQLYVGSLTGQIFKVAL
jgi:glucose/arabinose dehydrogenase